MKRTLLLTFGISLFVSAMAFSQTNKNALDSQLQQVIDAFLKKHADQEQFTAVSASVLIPHDKQLDLHDIKNLNAGTLGKAPFLRQVTPNDLYELGGITKSFVTVLILQLHTQQKLNLDDALGKWLPQYTQWSKVTIRQLLNRTSGIPNYLDNPAFKQKNNYFWTNEELLNYAYPNKPLTQDKDHSLSDSDSNYLLAALIIEKVTQDSFSHQLAQLFKQAHLNNSFYLAGLDAALTKSAIADHLMHGYYYDSSHTLRDSYNTNLSWLGAAGAIVSSTEDTVRWVQLLYRGTLINARYREDALAAMETLSSMKTGQAISTVSEQEPIGFGLGVAAYYDKTNKQTLWFYQGTIPGFQTVYLWNPCNGIALVVALNNEGKSQVPNPLMQVGLDLYETIIKSHNELQCAL